MNEPSDSIQLRILVVDDNEASARTMGWALELFEYDVRLAHDGTTALATALDYRPHVILMDISLPEVSGYELCQVMRTKHEFENTLFIAQTGWGEAEHRRRSADAGFAHHMLKPVDMIKLERILLEYAATLSLVSAA